MASSILLDVIRSLHLATPETSGLQNINDAQWRKLLPLTDRSQLTLPLGVRCSRHLPEWVRARIAGNLANNAIRHARIAETYQAVAAALTSQGIEFLVLKGFSHYPFYCDDLRHRPQYDLDLYCPPDAIQRAYDAIIGLGYEPFGRAGRTAIDHLPPLIRKTGWRAGDDYYDPDMPITIELHFRFWDRATERFDVSGADHFWERRQSRAVGPVMVPMLHSVDELSYATWHLVRHLVRGAARAYHVYELAHFLHRTAADDAFWRDWRDARPAPLVETIAFRLARQWFGPAQVNPVVQGLLEALPSKVQRWFDLFGFSPVLALEHPNKDELFLHFCLVNNLPDRLQVARRRLFPRRSSPYIADVHVASPDLRLRLKRRVVSASFLATRAFHHLRTLLPVVWSGFRWRRALLKPPPREADRKPRVETFPV
jgi:hypothetical protein